jgi:integrase
MPVETFLEKCREVIRLKHLSYRTEETYLPVIRRFIEFHGGRTHPKDMGAAEIRAYLSHLAVEQTVQELLGHKDVSTTMVYTHVLNRGGRGVRSPLDGIGSTRSRSDPAIGDEVFSRRSSAPFRSWPRCLGG